MWSDLGEGSEGSEGENGGLFRSSRLCTGRTSQRQTGRKDGLEHEKQQRMVSPPCCRLSCSLRLSGTQNWIIQVTTIESEADNVAVGSLSRVKSTNGHNNGLEHAKRQPRVDQPFGRLTSSVALMRKSTQNWNSHDESKCFFFFSVEAENDKDRKSPGHYWTNYCAPAEEGLEEGMGDKSRLSERNVGARDKCSCCNCSNSACRGTESMRGGDDIRGHRGRPLKERLEKGRRR